MVVNDDVPNRLGVSREQFDAIVARERRTLQERESLYRGGRARIDVAGRPVILVDDGLATGSTMAVAVDSVSEAGASKVVVAVPTAPSDAIGPLLDRGVDEVVVLTTPQPFEAVGRYYEDFGQVDDEDVIDCLER